MANTIKHKRASGSDPSAEDLVVGELAIRTDTGVVFTKKDDNSVAEIAGGGETNLGVSTTTTAVTVTSDTGDNAVISEASGSAAGVMSVAHHDKLDGIATGATNVSNTNQLTNGAGFITATLTEEQVEDFVGGMVTGNTETGITVTYQDSDGTLDFAVDSQTDNNFTTTLKNKLDGVASSANNYSHPSYNGDDFSVDTGALSGATVVSDIDINVTTDALGHVTDTNGSVSTRTLTLSDLGYSGATNANYITNNNQLTNGASYITSSGTSAGFSAGNASNLNSGTVGTARLGSGTANSSSYLRGDGAWSTISAGAEDGIFWENDQNVTSNYSITSGKNAMSAGPITIDSGYTVTVTSGSTWTVV